MNIAEPLWEQCRTRPDAVVIREPNGRRLPNGERAYREVTFDELRRRIERLAAAMTELGISPGDRCVLMVPPSIEFVELTFALFASGAVPVFVDPGIGLANLKECLGQAEPVAFIGVTKAHVARVLFGWAKATVRKFVTVGARFGWGGVTLARLREASTATMGITPTQRDDVAAILFTSGSTGVPKGAVYTHGMFLAQLEQLRVAFGIEPGEVDLCTFPLFALFGPALGMTSIIPVMDSTKPAEVDPREIIGPIQRFGVTNLFGSPALLNRVSRTARAELPSIRRVLSAGAPVAPAILERFSAMLRPEVQIYTPYGATEALPVAVIGSREVLGETRQLTAQGAGTCVGRPVEGLDVRVIAISDGPIASWSDDLILPMGEIGEIVVNGPQATQEYFRRPELTRLAKIEDASRGRSWHRMGDVGYFDAQGRLWFCGRKSQRIVTTDRVYFTDPVEGIFNTHPDVFRTALVGVKRGETTLPVLCVELEKSIRRSRNVIARELRELGGTIELTRPLTTILFHKHFPVDIRHNSKIFREKLAIWAADHVR